MLASVYEDARYQALKQRQTDTVYIPLDKAKERLRKVDEASSHMCPNAIREEAECVAKGMPYIPPDTLDRQEAAREVLVYDHAARVALRERDDLRDSIARDVVAASADDLLAVVARVEAALSSGHAALTEWHRIREDGSLKGVKHLPDLDNTCRNLDTLIRQARGPLDDARAYVSRCVKDTTS